MSAAIVRLRGLHEASVEKACDGGRYEHHVVFQLMLRGCAIGSNNFMFYSSGRREQHYKRAQRSQGDGPCKRARQLKQRRKARTRAVHSVLDNVEV